MKLIENNRTHTNNEFIKKSQNIHKDNNGEPLYDYSKIKYTDDIKKEVQNILDYIKKYKINEI